MIDDDSAAIRCSTAVSCYATVCGHLTLLLCAQSLSYDTKRQHLKGVIQRPSSGPHWRSGSLSLLLAKEALPSTLAYGAPLWPASHTVGRQGLHCGGVTAPGGWQQAKSWTT